LTTSSHNQAKGATYRSSSFASAHELASALYDEGIIDKRTIRDFDVRCLTTVEDLAPEQIREIRDRAAMSQGIFAQVLNVTTNLVSKWERGEKHPSGTSLKLLSLAKTKGIDAIL